MKKKILIEYQEFTLATQLQDKEKELLDRAIEAADNAYSPFSKFSVGAAARLSTGEILTAANQESEAFPSGLCAERTLIFYVMANYPKSAIQSIAIAAKRDGKLTDEPTRPCGACVQVMLDAQNRGGEPMSIILGGKEKIEVISSINDLLPFSFDNLK